MTLLGRWLPVAYREPDHQEARIACLVASCQAAIAFNSANLGLAHAFAAPLGALFHVPHGLGNALALPVVAAYNEKLADSVVSNCYGVGILPNVKDLATLKWASDLTGDHHAAQTLDAYLDVFTHHYLQAKNQLPPQWDGPEHQRLRAVGSAAHIDSCALPRTQHVQ